MILSLDNLIQFGEPIDTLEYRGFRVDFYEELSGHQLIAVWENKIFEFGVYNTQALEDMKLVIDDHLDTITRFSEQPAFYGAKLERFQNAGFSDVRLWFKGRLLGVWPEPSDLELKFIEKAAEERILEELNRRHKTNY
jgi:hypothetical protein